MPSASVMAENRVRATAVDLVLYGFGALSMALVVPALPSVDASMRAREAIARAATSSRRASGRPRRAPGAGITCGYGAAVGIVLCGALFIIANDVAVGRTFFLLPLIGKTFGLVLTAFWHQCVHFLHRRDPGPDLGARGRDRAAGAGRCRASRCA